MLLCAVGCGFEPDHQAPATGSAAAPSTMADEPRKASRVRHPYVAILAPADDASFSQGSVITVEVEALSGHEAVWIEQVTLHMDGSIVETKSQAPYVFSITPSLGEHRLQATARDAERQPGESKDVYINIIEATDATSQGSSGSGTGSSETSGGTSTGTGTDTQATDGWGSSTTQSPEDDSTGSNSQAEGCTMKGSELSEPHLPTLSILMLLWSRARAMR